MSGQERYANCLPQHRIGSSTLQGPTLNERTPPSYLLLVTCIAHEISYYQTQITDSKHKQLQFSHVAPLVGHIFFWCLKIAPRVTYIYNLKETGKTEGLR